MENLERFGWMWRFENGHGCLTRAFLGLVLVFVESECGEHGQVRVFIFFWYLTGHLFVNKVQASKELCTEAIKSRWTRARGHRSDRLAPRSRPISLPSVNNYLFNTDTEIQLNPNGGQSKPSPKDSAFLAPGSEYPSTSCTLPIPPLPPNSSNFMAHAA